MQLDWCVAPRTGFKVRAGKQAEPESQSVTSVLRPTEIERKSQRVCACTKHVRHILVPTFADVASILIARSCRPSGLMARSRLLGSVRTLSLRCLCNGVWNQVSPLWCAACGGHGHLGSTAHQGHRSTVGGQQSLLSRLVARGLRRCTEVQECAQASSANVLQKGCSGASRYLQRKARRYSFAIGCSHTE